MNKIQYETLIMQMSVQIKPNEEEIKRIALGKPVEIRKSTKMMKNIVEIPLGLGRHLGCMGHNVLFWGIFKDIQI